MDEERPPGGGETSPVVERPHTRHRGPGADEAEVAVLVAAREVRTLVQQAVARAGLQAVIPLHLAAWASDHRAPVVVTDNSDHITDIRTRLAVLVPDVAFVVLPDDPGPDDYRRLVGTGAAVLPGTATAAQIRAAVVGARERLASLPVGAARAALSDAGDDGRPPVLAPREAAWLGALADGMTVASLARTAGYSQREMYRLLSGAYSRLGVTTRTEALLVADRRGLLRRASTPPPQSARAAEVDRP